MMRHRIYKWSGRWCAQCSGCTKCVSSKYHWEVMLILEQHVLRTHPLTIASASATF